MPRQFRRPTVRSSWLCDCWATSRVITSPRAAGLRIVLGPSPEPSCVLSPAVVSPLPETIGYVKVDGCLCEGAAGGAYAEALQRAIRMADRPGLIGWIVDLRTDGGGNMWPMMAGLGPILGEGIMGWIVYNNREYERRIPRRRRHEFRRNLRGSSEPLYTD